MENLNESQRAHGLQTDGPVLVLAGAGSGKTRVLTYRIAYLIASGLATSKDILAMTFTNKAASEMKNRVAFLTSEAATDISMGTFHSIFARILRIEGEKIGIKRNFSIYDEDDQKRLIKALINEYNHGSTLNPNQLRAQISNAKNALITPELFFAEADNDIAKKVVEKLIEFGTKMIIITAGYGSKEKKVCGAATSLELVKKIKTKYNIDTEYQGPFYGFSGLVFGAAKLKKAKAISLFSGVEAQVGNPEYPAKESAELLIKTLKKILKNPEI